MTIRRGDMVMPRMNLPRTKDHGFLLVMIIMGSGGTPISLGAALPSRIKAGTHGVESTGRIASGDTHGAALATTGPTPGGPGELATVTAAVTVGRRTELGQPLPDLAPWMAAAPTGIPRRPSLTSGGDVIPRTTFCRGIVRTKGSNHKDGGHQPTDKVEADHLLPGGTRPHEDLQRR